MKNDRSFIYDRTVLTPFGLGLDVNINSIKDSKSTIQWIDRSTVESDFPIKYCGQVEWEDLGLTKESDTLKSIFAIRKLFSQIPNLNKIDRLDKVFCLVRYLTLTDIENDFLESYEKRMEKRVGSFFLEELRSRGIQLKKNDIAFIDNSCTSGNCVLGFAHQGIKLGMWESCLVVAVDLVDFYNLLILNGLGVLSNTSPDPKTSSRPFDKHRSGFVKSDGAAAALVCNDSFATRNGLTAKPIEILSFTQSADAYRLTDGRDDVASIMHAMKSALNLAQLDPDEISFIKAHGTGTKLNDEHEAKAIQKIFSSRKTAVPILGMKGHLGHVTDASGLVETLIAGEAALRGTILATKNCDEPDFDLDIIQQPRPINGRKYFMSNTVGFGGNNSSLIIGADCGEENI